MPSEFHGRIADEADSGSGVGSVGNGAEAGAGADAELVAQVRRGATRLARRLRQERPDEALSAMKILVLAYLHRWGPATPGEIASAEDLPPQSLTRALGELEAQELLTRDRDERDRRQYVLEITAAGLLVLAQDMDARDHWLAQAMTELSETERQVLRLAAVLMDSLSDFGRPPRAEPQDRRLHQLAERD